jgi:hypothetical protein
MTPLAKKVFELFGKPELAAEVTLKETVDSAVASWPCPHCGQPATIKDVGPSLDGQRTLTFWSCEPCGVAAVTPDGLRQPPTGWVRRMEQ